MLDRILKFQVLKLDSDEDVLGGPVMHGNVYISVYPRELDRSPSELKVGEEVVATYKLCGQRELYRIRRVQ